MGRRADTIENAVPVTRELVDPGSRNDNEEAPKRALPETPIVTIAPTKGWVALDLRDLWFYRELLFFLIWRDVKIRYKQTALGVSWAILQPLLAMLLFTLVFGRVAKVPSDGVPYALFSYIGLLPWMFFSNAMTASGLSLVQNTPLISKVYFPRILIPTAAVGAGLMDFAISALLLLPLMWIYDTPLTWSASLLPVLGLLTAILALGLGMWSSAVNVKYRDVKYALPFAIQLWMFATPIIYPASMIPERWRSWMALNPMAGIVEASRSALLGRPIDWFSLSIAAGLSLVILIYAAFYFRRVEKQFADIV